MGRGVAAVWGQSVALGGGRISLNARQRRLLFREARLLPAALMLAAFPFVLMLGAPPAALATLVLLGLLPAAIALDAQRQRRLARPLVFCAITSGTLMVAGCLVGIPFMALYPMVLVLVAEVAIIGGRRTRLPVLAVLAVAFAAAGLVQALDLARVPEGDIHSVAATAAGMGFLHALVIMLALRRALIRASDASRLARLFAEEIDRGMSETVLALDSRCQVLRATSNALALLQVPARSLRGSGLREHIMVADRPAVLSAIAAVALAPADAEVERELRFRLRILPGGAGDAPTYRWVACRLRRSPGAEPVALAALRDIEAVVASEQAALRAEQEAERASAARSAFLATVNHELRTPLNAIIGFSEILSNPQSMPARPEQVREYAGIIHQAGGDLFRLVTSMIDLTRLDAGIYDFNPDACDLAHAVRLAVESFRQEPEAEGAPITVTAPEGEHIALLDVRAFRRALGVLLSNAVKFGGRGQPVTVEVVRLGATEMAVHVRDQGPGMAPELVARLTERFARGDEGHSRTAGGLGLGLALARGLVDLHGGRLAVESAPGAGATVSLILPLLPAAPVVPLPVTREVQPAPTPAPLREAVSARRRSA